MTTSLVGVSDPSHGRENFALSKVEPADPGKILALFS
jgi:hypothetical protein